VIRAWRHQQAPTIPGVSGSVLVPRAVVKCRSFRVRAASGVIAITVRPSEGGAQASDQIAGDDHETAHRCRRRWQRLASSAAACRFLRHDQLCRHCSSAQCTSRLGADHLRMMRATAHLAPAPKPASRSAPCGPSVKDLAGKRTNKFCDQPYLNIICSPIVPSHPPFGRRGRIVFPDVKVTLRLTQRPHLGRPLRRYGKTDF